MVTKRKLLCNKDLAKVSSFVYPQPVSLGTKVPEEIKSEDLLAAPNEGAFRKELSKINKRINKITKKLSEKLEHNKQVPPINELMSSKKKLQEEKVNFHKKRKETEMVLKSLTRSIKMVLITLTKVEFSL